MALKVFGGPARDDPLWPMDRKILLSSWISKVPAQFGERLMKVGLWITFEEDWNGGSVNAGFLSHLRITFPATERMDGQSGEIRLKEESLQDLQLLQNECTKLNTLKVLVYNQSPSYLITEDQDNTEFACDALLKINAEFRCIPSLARIILRHSGFEGGP
ncbi:hypothetical protein N7489_000250 [Penicillium chrysogenum]|uniref:Uncharacterized protein n=1 Tax=Penicillium chrysogenum TaxID=5076 RepID=A0ABQ8WFL9_PENCH|nr:uncharacterized protein N7489_000250 [Penicillium chrysogenum]KAJ5249840.1 hypothetical protein N7489_000250 [Penicillium chrysogenum]KAJ5268746.1 hypothetical protein N7505_004504 [Penicillium chrysogenum]KAJ6148545.1 hypothetical protein N7497_010527 [Penicillium chrysogenum]